MSVNFTWFINYSEKRTKPHMGLNEVITSCRWELTAEELHNGETLVEKTYGFATFSDPDPVTFVAHEDVKQATVLDWVWAGLDKEEIENLLVLRLNERKYPDRVINSIPL
jgi:hypothetical protein